MTRTNGGTALVFWVLVLTVIGSMTTLLVSRAANNAYETTVEQARLEAFYAAEGALAELRQRLSRNPDLARAQIQIGRCRCQILVTRDGDDWLATIEAFAYGTGELGRPVRCRLEARLSGGPIPDVRQWRDASSAQQRHLVDQHRAR